MKNIILICCTLGLVLSMGCISPWAAWNRAEENYEEKKEETRRLENSQVEAAKTYAHGTAKAIEIAKERAVENNATEEVKKPIEVAKKLNERVELALGPPDIDNALEIEQVIMDLLSENEDLRIRGEKALQLKDTELSVIQKKLHSTEDKLYEAEQKLLQVGRDNARLAQKWDDLTGWFWWLAVAFVAYIILSIIVKLIPIFFPMTGASGTLHRLVRSVQTIRDNHDVDVILKETLDEADKSRVDKAKRRMGLK